MKALAFPVLLFSIATVAAQVEWTPAIPITTGEQSDTHPACIITPIPLFPVTVELIAFSRQNPGEVWKNIYVIPSGPAALTWPGPLAPLRSGNRRSPRAQSTLSIARSEQTAQ